MESMLTIRSRQLQDEDDYQAVRTLLQRIWHLEGPPDYCTVGDLDWWRFTEEDPSAIFHARIWIDGDEVVGFAWPSGERLDHVTLPSHRQLEPEMVRWAADIVGGSGEYMSMSAFAYDSHEWREAPLIELGFERGEPSLKYWFRQLDDLQRIEPAGDYTLRHLRGADEVASRVAAHRDAFAPSKMTEAKHLAVMSSPTYRQDLDLVAEASDGSIAAYCIVWFDEANAHGVFEPVGCHSAHRRRGLTKALMFEGMRRLRDLGARSATVVSHPTEVAANRLYASAGFTCLDVLTEWTKPLK